MSTLAIAAPAGSNLTQPIGTNAPSAPASPSGTSTPSVTAPAHPAAPPPPQAKPSEVPAFFVKALGLKDATSMSPWELQVVAQYLTAVQANNAARTAIQAYVPGNKSYDALPEYMKTTYNAANASLKTLATTGAGPVAASKVQPPAPPAPTGGIAAVEHGVQTFLVWLTSKLSTRA